MRNRVTLDTLLAQDPITAEEYVRKRQQVLSKLRRCGARCRCVWAPLVPRCGCCLHATLVALPRLHEMTLR